MIQPVKFSRLAMATALVLATAACTAPPEKTGQGGAMPLDPYSDNEILQVIQTVNESEIEQGQVALTRSSAPEIRGLAQRIIQEHRELESDVRAIEIELEDSPMSRGLRTQGAEIQQALAALASPEFDCTYLQSQVQQHQVTLQLVQNQLMPDAESANVKQVLEDAADMLEAHHTAARDAQVELPECDAT